MGFYIGALLAGSICLVVLATNKEALLVVFTLIVGLSSKYRIIVSEGVLYIKAVLLYLH